GGRSLPHAVLMMIPEAWENHESMPADKRAFYQFHASLMEPWDGPASIAFTDGTVVGAVLDRNGLRPSRYWVTADGLVVMASEVGVLDIDPAEIVQRGRLQPGRMFLVDTSRGRIIDDDELKGELAAQHPYGEWLFAGLVHLDDLPARHFLTPQHGSVIRQQRVFGYTTEELKVILAPTPASCRQIVVPHPILSNADLAKLLYINEDGDQPGFKPFAVDGLYPVEQGGDGLRRALDDVRARVSEAIEAGAKIIILSDRHSNEAMAPIPSLLLVSAVHHHLIREKTRTRVGLVVECGDAREVHHMALLLGYGAAAINPYLAFESIEDLIDQGYLPGLSKGQAMRNYIKACGKGVL